MERFVWNIYQNCRQESLIANGDRVLISVSGGCDSVALLHILCAFQEKCDLTLEVAHFHHGLRQESDREEEFVRSLCSDIGCDCSVFRRDDLQNCTDRQNIARQWRRTSLQHLAEQHACHKIALGHHLDDLAETQVWRLTRGTSLFSLHPMRQIAGRYIRPLLYTSKTDLKAYLNRHKRCWHEDASNQETSYSRNFIRHRVIPTLDQQAGGCFIQKSCDLALDSLLLEEAYLQIVGEDTFKDNLPYASITALPKLFGLECIRRFLSFHGIEEINRGQLHDICQLVQAGKNNWQIALHKGQILAGRGGAMRLVNKSQS